MFSPKEKRRLIVALLSIGIVTGVYNYFSYSGVVNTDSRISKYIVEETSETTDSHEQSSNSPAILKKYAKLYEVNNDLVGFIYLDNDHKYPVVQNKDDQNYYLYRNFFGEELKSGSIFLNSQCNLGDKGISLIYGHHMRDNSMFGSIDELIPQSTLQLDTIYESHEYEVIASCVCNLNDDFKYFSYVGYQSSYDFEVWKQGMNSHLIRGSLDSLDKDDVIVELSTCSYRHKGDRYIVILKEVDNDAKNKR